MDTCHTNTMQNIIHTANTQLSKLKTYYIKDSHSWINYNVNSNNTS